ncbi:MAG: carbon-nitrogen hydrolase family protein [Desulfobacteraceae bacterium]|nr:carbon-nitrogen hydrolase family protein [Desulfobacteraceae bacterium]
MSRLFGIACIQMDARPMDLEHNLSEMVSHVQRIAGTYPMVRMMVFSEYCLYGDSLPQARFTAESIPNAMTDRLGEIARQYNTWLIPGTILEAVDGKIHNTALAISPDGRIAAAYRKLFPWQPLEKTDPGKDFCVFDVPGIGRFGLCICYDMWFPEVCRTLAWMGAEVILHPTMTTTGDREQELVLARANAIFNQCYFIDVNGVGAGGIGASTITDPHGRVIQTAGESPMVMVEILDLDLVTTVREYGTAGINQHLKQLKAFPQRFPPYNEGMQNGDGFRNLGKVQQHREIKSR